MISLIIPVWNHCEDLTRPFLENLLGKTRGFEYEVCMVDNGSTDGTWRYINSRPIHAIHSEKNLGFGGGNNLGYSQSCGDIICFLSNDVEIGSPDWLSRIVTTLMEKPKSLVGPHLVLDNMLTAFRYKPIPYINGWCIAGQRKIFDAIIAGDPERKTHEVFDTGFGTAYFEDVELSYAAKILGYELLEVSGTGLTHLGGKSSDQISIPHQTKVASQYFFNKVTAMDLEKRKVKRIVFMAAGVPYGFIDGDYEGKGVGGSEAAIILLARELARRDFQVEIYNNTTMTGLFNGVWYHNVSEFRYGDYCDVFILFRSFNYSVLYANSIHKIFWSCDQYTDAIGIWNKFIFPHVGRVVAISPYHRGYLETFYMVKPGQVICIELGVLWDDYKEPLEKKKGKTIFCSVPQRGLEKLSILAPLIKERVPDFELFITSDYRLWGIEKPLNGEYIYMFRDIPYVHFLGMIPRKDLLYHQKTSEIMAYPCVYEECFCISALECQAAGAVPVTSDKGALSTTIGDCGIVLSNTDFDARFVESVIELLADPVKRNEYVTRGRKKAEAYDWKRVADDWISLIDDMDNDLQQTSGVVCDICSREFGNSYVLLRHQHMKHPEYWVRKEGMEPLEEVTDIPKVTKLRFSQPVEVQINDMKFQGTEIDVPFEMVGSIMEIVRNSYGSDAIL